MKINKSLEYKTIDNFNFKGKRVLVRADLNSPLRNGKVELNPRFEATAKTIKELKKKNARVVILAHQSRPGKADCISLKQHAKLLSKYTKVRFIDDILGFKALERIEKLKNGEALLLDNIRFLKEEYKPSSRNKIVKTLGKHFNIYVNDAFSNSHKTAGWIR